MNSKIDKTKNIIQPHLKPIIRYGGGMVSKAGGLTLAVLAQILFARLMGPSKYGLMVLTLATILLPANLATLGVDVSLSRFIAVYLGERKLSYSRNIAFKGAIFMGVMSLSLMVVFLTLNRQLAALMKLPSLGLLLLTFAFFIPAIFLHKWTLSILRGLGHNATQITLESPVLQIFILGCGYILWNIYGTVQSVILGHGIAYAVVAATGCYLSTKSLLALPASDSSGSPKFKEIVMHGIPINITSLAQQLLRRGDVLIVGALLGEAAVGIYRCAYSIASGVKQLMTPINNFALFRMSKNVGRKKVNAVFDYYHLAILLTLALALPLYLVIFVFADKIINIIFGSQYTSAIPILKVLTIGFIIFLGVGPLGSLFNAIGRNWSRMWMVLCVSVNNIILNILLIKWLGLLGSAISTSISFTILYITFLFYLRKNFLRGYAGVTSLILMLFTVGLGLALESSFSFGPLIQTIMTVFSSVFVFIVGAYVSYRYQVSIRKVAMD